MCKYLTVDVDFLKLPQENGLIPGLRQLIQDELKSINKRQPAFFAKTIHVSRGVFHEWYFPSTPNPEVIYPP